MPQQVMQYKELSENQKFEVADIIVEGFGHLLTFTKDMTILKTMIFRSLNPEYTYALVENATVLGTIGLATNQIRPVKFGIETCVEFFGRLKGNILYKELNAMFQSKVVKNDTDLYIEFLATSSKYRGKGAATQLLEYSFNLPKYQTYYIDVFSKNDNARRLYQKIGFEEIKKNRLSPLAFKGYGYPIKMKK